MFKTYKYALLFSKFPRYIQTSYYIKGRWFTLFLVFMNSFFSWEGKAFFHFKIIKFKLGIPNDH